MHYQYNPSSEKELFALRVYNILVENFSQTFFVGGMIRDLLLHKPVTDIDIATEVTPDTIIALLEQHSITLDDANKQFGITVAKNNDTEIEIATLRTDTYTGSRYPKVTFTTDVQQDSTRRDFTINSLYFKAKTGEILDFHNGVMDIENKVLRFIGDTLKRIEEDPLRIVRAYRFHFTLQFAFAPDTEIILQHNLHLLKNISAQRIETELQKCNNEVKNKIVALMHKNT